MFRSSKSKKTSSTDIKLLKRKHANAYHQLLPNYIGEHELKQNNIDFESARELLMKEDDTMVVKRRFERIYIMMECNLYMQNEDIPENKEIFVYGFKHIKIYELDVFILIRCDSDELNENEKLFNFLCNEFLNKEIEKRDFKITGWSFMTLVKRNKFFEIQSLVCS